MFRPDDDDLFRRAMHDVRTLRSEPRRHAGKPPPRIYTSVHAKYDLSVDVEGKRPEQSEGPWVLKADGISRGRLRQLANGQPPVDIEIDLHGMTCEKAFVLLDHCMRQALTRRHRVLCLVHGRGLHSRDGRPILKEAIYLWLAQGPFAGHVLAAMPKPETRGGSCLVLLRRKR